MPERTASAVWKGPVPQGQGTVSVESGLLDAQYSFGSRFESAAGTNPEELLGAAHAGCFTMAFALGLTERGHPPTRVSTTARVTITKTSEGFRIPRIVLTTEAEVPGLDQRAFEREAEKAKTSCPVSLALAGTDITLEAKLLG
jgi:osmotically inducible protein OsmC